VHGPHHDVIGELRQPSRELRDQIPGVWNAFGQLHKEAVADGALPGHIKELIALAISVVDGCDGCIAYHARGAAHKGASEQEAAEALGVTLLMAGGPATIWGPRALEAFREFKATAPEAVG